MNLFYLIYRSSKLKIKELIIFTIILVFLFPLINNGQEVNGGMFITYSEDSLMHSFSEIDTNYINNQKKYDLFYDSLIYKASKNKLTKTALDLLLVNNPQSGKFVGIENLKNEEYYKLYSGKTIRNIDVIKLDVFGPTLTNPNQGAKSWFQKAGNNTHIKTRKFIIQNNLFFEKGDTIDPSLLVDNERLLRELDYIKNASIEIAEVPDNPNLVDILIITKDVYSAGIYIDLYNSTSGAFEVYENNLAGIGHRLLASMQWNSLEDTPFGYSFKYRIGNIGNTFIKSNIEYLNSFNTEKYEINFTRKFVSYNTKWAGKLSFKKIATYRDIQKTDTLLKNTELDYFSNDVWFGRSFLIKTGNLHYQNRSRLVLGIRYIDNNFSKGPEVRERYNFQYHDNQIALASIAFARQKHYKSNLIYGFGKTEDIPIGTIIQINAGLEKDEFLKRPYWGFKYSRGSYYPKIGYLNFETEFGAYFYTNKIEQGVVNFKAQAISNLFYYNKLKLREFLSINYTRGFNRFPDESIYLNSTNIWGLESSYLFGLQKLSFNSEVVAFTNIHIYNFKFLFFGFADLGLVGPENHSIFKQELYSGIGLGFRVRNENLVFKTFQIRLAFYPKVPADSDQFYFLLSGENYQKPISFEPSAPYTIDYK